jgi:uncharacterized membrane protein HdeD (DUF308 family)
MFGTNTAALEGSPGAFSAVRGILAILFGIIALVWPGISLLALTYLFGAYALINGLVAIVSAIRGRSTIKSWWAVLIEGLAGVAIGLLTFFWPHVTILALLLLIATWSVIIGILEIGIAFSSRAATGERWMIGIAGALSIIFGILLFTHPGAGLLAMIWLLGFYSIVWGIILIAHSFQRPRAMPYSQAGT